MDWIQQLLQTDAKIRLGEKAVMLQDLNQVAQFNRQSVAAAQRQFLGETMPTPEANEDNMGMQVGDNHTHNYIPPQKGGMSPVIGALIGAGLMAVGGPLAVLAWNAVVNRPPAPVASPKVIDTDTKYDIRLWP